MMTITQPNSSPSSNNPAKTPALLLASAAVFGGLMLAAANMNAGTARPVPTPQYVNILPVEVTSGTPARIVMLTTTALATQAVFQIHGLEADGEGSVQFDSAPALPLTNANVTVEPHALAYGGIGGGFSTLALTVPASLPAGTHRLTFRFQLLPDAAGIYANSEYRVLAIDLANAQGQSVVRPHSFAQHDVTLEAPPLPSATDINQGDYLWHNANLMDSPLTHTLLKAGCSSCHSAGGEDLKYYGYSNYSIYQRCLFHGFTDLQAKQVASYIRTVKYPNGTPVPTYGRPWNPPYQPGPGTDSKPAPQWAAGAGLGAVLPSDAALLPFLFPRGIVYNPADAGGIGWTATLNMRELPTSLQLPDWNHWLPRVHPLDAWGNVWANSWYRDIYDGGAGPGYSHDPRGNFLARLNDPDPASYAAFTNSPDAFLYHLFGTWTGGDYGDFLSHEQAGNDGTALYQERMVGTEHWMLVKNWELMQKYNLEGNAPQIFPTAPGAPTAGESRSWLSEAAFFASPAFIGIREDGSLFTRPVYEYQTNAWYYAQMVLNSGNRHRQAFHPVDWGYAVGRTGDGSDASGLPSIVRMTAMLVKGLQQSDTDNSMSFNTGWVPHFACDVRFFSFHNSAPYLDKFSPDVATSNSIYGQIITAVAQAQEDKMQTHTPAEYQASTQGPEGAVIYGQDSLFNEEQETLRDLTNLGINHSVINRRADFDAQVWPNFNWNALRPQ